MTYESQIPVKARKKMFCWYPLLFTKRHPRWMKKNPSLKESFRLIFIHRLIHSQPISILLEAEKLWKLETRSSFCLQDIHGFSFLSFKNVFFMFFHESRNRRELFRNLSRTKLIKKLFPFSSPNQIDLGVGRRG